MPRLFPLSLIVFSLALLVFSVVGSDGYAKYLSLREHLGFQKRRNEELSLQVQTIQNQLDALKSDARVLERTVRSELGMARPNEIIFIFEDSN